MWVVPRASRWCKILSKNSSRKNPIKGLIPEEEYTVPFGKAHVRREGNDATIVATMYMVHVALGAATKLEEEGISVEIVDPRTLVPLDQHTIIESVKKTGRLIVVSEDNKTAGVSAEIAALAAEEAIDYLDAPIKRVAKPDTPIPFSPPLEKYIIPDKQSIIEAVRETI